MPIHPSFTVRHGSLPLQLAAKAYVPFLPFHSPLGPFFPHYVLKAAKPSDALGKLSFRNFNY